MRQSILIILILSVFLHLGSAQLKLLPLLKAKEYFKPEILDTLIRNSDNSSDVLMIQIEKGNKVYSPENNNDSYNLRVTILKKRTAILNNG